MILLGYISLFPYSYTTRIAICLVNRSCLQIKSLNNIFFFSPFRGQEKHRHYLEALGFVPGSEVTILSELHGYYIVMVKGSKIGLDKTLAKKIIVYAN